MVVQAFKMIMRMRSKRIVFFLMLCLMMLGAQAQMLSSPDGAWQLTFSLQRGRPVVSVVHNGQAVVRSRGRSECAIVPKGQ